MPHDGDEHTAPLRSEPSTQPLAALVRVSGAQDEVQPVSLGREICTALVISGLLVVCVLMLFGVTNSLVSLSDHYNADLHRQAVPLVHRIPEGLLEVEVLRPVARRVGVRQVGGRHGVLLAAQVQDLMHSTNRAVEQSGHSRPPASQSVRPVWS